MATIRQITMYADVGFDLTHKHCIDFENEDERNGYFANLTDKTHFDSCNYNKADNTLNLECPWTEGLRFTYCTFLFDDRIMFYFVTGSKVVNDRVTAFELQMDVWQTFMFDVRPSEGMIVREHVDRWDKDGNILWKRASCEDTISVYDKNITQPINSAPVAEDKGYKLSIGAIYISYLGKEGSDDKGYNRIMIPVFNVTAPEDKKDYAMTYFITYHPREERDVWFLPISAILKGRIDIFEGLDANSIMSISYNPIFQFTFEKNASESAHFTMSVSDESEKSVHVTIDAYGVPRPLTKHDYRLFANWKDRLVNYNNTEYYCFIEDMELTAGDFFGDITMNKSVLEFSKPVLPKENDDYSPQHEPELFKQPYIVRTILDSEGSLVYELPDLSWFDDKSFYYMELNDNNETSLCYVITDDVIEIPNGQYAITGKDFSKISSMGLTVMVRSIALDVPSDVWKSYVISSRNTDRELLQTTINQQAVTSAIGAITGMAGISGMAGSGKGEGIGFNPAQAVVGGAIGAIMSAASYVANNHFEWEKQEIKEKAIRNQPNNLLKTATGDGIVRLYPILHSYNEQICSDSAFAQASGRYHKFGYRVDMYDIPNIKTRKFFNFVQTDQIRIEGSVNQAIKNAFAKIFNNGVTIWHGEYITKDENGKFVIDYSKENIERSLL